jgi:predicted CopG family antitoxin
VAALHRCFACERAIYVTIVMFIVVFMTTISVTEDVKQKLLKVASELQLRLGRRVDLNEALRFLIDRQEKNVQLLEEACKPMAGAKEVVEELQMERKRDESRLERKVGVRHQRAD